MEQEIFESRIIKGGSHKANSYRSESHKAKSRKAESHGEISIKFSHFQKIKQSKDEQLRAEILFLIKMHDRNEIQARKGYEKYKYWKNKKNEYESDFHYMSYRSYFDQTQRLGKEIQAKLNDIQKFKSSLKMLELKTFLEKKMQQQMKYGQSDDEE